MARRGASAGTVIPQTGSFATGSVIDGKGNLYAAQPRGFVVDRVMTPAEGMRGYDGLRVFSATTVGRRERLGEDITGWLAAHPERIPVHTLVLQSSDARFHCFTIVLFWSAAAPAK